MSIYKYTNVSTCMYAYMNPQMLFINTPHTRTNIYIYIYKWLSLSLYIYIYIYI